MSGLIKIIKIASKLFPERYKKYTDFVASYGFVGVYQDGSVILFLDARYYTSAQDAGVSFKPLREMPRENLVLDPFEWTITDIANFKFVDPIFRNFEEYKLAHGIELGNIDIISHFLFENPGKCYLASNMDTMSVPTNMLVFNEDGVIQAIDDGFNVLFDPDITPVAYASKLRAENAITDPVRVADSIMDDIDGYKKFLINDCIAWMNFWQKLEWIYSGITEIDAAQILELERKKIHGQQFSLAFETIAGCNENAAKIHGRASDKMLEDGILLVDAGSKLGCYNSDITRVFLLGSCNHITKEFKEAYTKTLKAHIAVITCEFSKNTPAADIDALARKYVQFDHALGHAIGKSDVHAFPPIRGGVDTSLKNGMILAIEPGFYVPGKFGVRLESVVRVIETSLDNFAFDYLIFIPFEYDLVEHTMLEDFEHEWLSKYHEMCYNKLKEYVDIGFLEKKTCKFIK